MRVSVLLPTRNGAKLLQNCLRSILGQSYSDFELIVSDNASSDETQNVLERYRADERLKEIRLETPVSVTENWAVVLNAASGDYVLVLGDDDLLLPGYFEHATRLLDEFESPDCLTYNGYAYAFPDALAAEPTSYYADPFDAWDPDLPTRGLISRGERIQLVHDLFRFNYRINLNLQTTLVARRAIERLRNGVFKPPFPDFYAFGALLLTAESWAYTPDQLVVVGISQKSFGRSLHSQGQAKGLDYLGISTEFERKLPGNEIIDGTHLTLLRLKEDYAPELAGVEIDRAEYVVQQVYASYLQWRVGSLTGRQLLGRLALLSPGDWLRLARMVGRRLSPSMLYRHTQIRRSEPVRWLWPGLEPLEGVQTNSEFVEWLAHDRQPSPT